MLDQAGAVTGRTRYGLYGEVRERTGPVPSLAVGFAGRYGCREDTLTTLVRCGVRWYSPALGRWLTRDPIGYKGGENQYAYVEGDPVNFVDPSGLKVWIINRILMGNAATPIWNDVSHTFIAVTDSAGNVEHTYSWGNKFHKFPAVSRWYKDQTSDMKAAKKAIEKNYAKEVPALDNYEHYVEDSFERLQNHPSSEHNWDVNSNCKHAASELIKEAHSRRLIPELQKIAPGLANGIFQ